MRHTLIMGNWKMHGDAASAVALAQAVRDEAHTVPVSLAVCPPFVHISLVSAVLSGSPVALGAQSLAREPEGAFTGEVSATMLADLDCRYVLVGHSERRALYGETDAVVADKFQRAREAGLTPVLCVGETLAEREAGETAVVVRRQLTAVLDAAGPAEFSSAVLAYEPVWAIGTGRTATPEQAQAVHADLRACLAEWDAALADDMTLLYGGSVQPDNAAALLAETDIDGALVGGASLQAATFMEIAKQAGMA